MDATTDSVTPEQRAAIGIDLGATHIRAAVIETDGTIIGAIRHALPDDPHARRRSTADITIRLLADHPHRDIDEIGLAVAGTVSNGVMTWSANLGLDAVDHREEVQAATGRRVTVINDARAAALAEAHFARDVDATTILMVTVGTGIGGGIVLNGDLHYGTGNAGEIGHIVIDPHGPPCRCGHRGCWEQMAGGVALNAAAAEEARAHPGGLIATAAGHGRPSAAGLAQAAASGDSTAVAIIRHHAELFATGLDGICAVIAPDLLLLGGGIIARSSPIREAYLAAARNLRWHKGQTRTVRLGDDAGMIGAALAAWKQGRNGSGR